MPYLVSWFISGYSPDTEPLEFGTWEDAVKDAERLVGQIVDDYREECIDMGAFLGLHHVHSTVNPLYSAEYRIVFNDPSTLDRVVEITEVNAT